jgi:hypothetical protein
MIIAARYYCLHISASGLLHRLYRAYGHVLLSFDCAMNPVTLEDDLLSGSGGLMLLRAASIAPCLLHAALMRPCS